MTAVALEVVAGEVGAAVEALGEMASAGLVDAIYRKLCIGK